MLPDEIHLKLEGPTAIEATVRDSDGRYINNVEQVTITYRAYEIGLIRVDCVDPDGPVVDGELPIISRTYEVGLDTPVSAEFKAWALLEQPT